MADAKTYDQCSTEQKIRINAVILAAITKDEPKGIVQTIKQSLGEHTTNPLCGNAKSGILATLKAVCQEFSDALQPPRGFGGGQTFLDGLRNKLAALPEDQLPTIPGKINNPDASLAAQRDALRGMLEEIEKGNALKDAKLANGQTLNNKLVFSGNFADYPNAEKAVREYVSDATKDMCTNKNDCSTFHSMSNLQLSHAPRSVSRTIG